MAVNYTYIKYGVVILILILVWRSYKAISSYYIDVDDFHDENLLTIRVNTYKRNDLLEEFLDTYKDCPSVSEIQVVWSDVKSNPPSKLVNISPKVSFEKHQNNSLTNRFRPILPIRTEGVLSIDDDIIIPCQDLHDSFKVWRSNPRSLVGFSPRMYSYDVNSGASKYLKWQHTWWNGIYAIVLTKAAFLHRDYFRDYAHRIPSSLNTFVDHERNCEDIVMAHLVATESNTPPVWVKVNAYEISNSGISSGSTHFSDRSHCLEVIRQTTGIWPWIVGSQKVVSISFWDLFSLWK